MSVLRLFSQLGVCALLCLSACQSAALRDIDQIFELAPGASQAFTLTNDQERKVGWRLVDKEPTFTCPEGKCVMLERQDDVTYIGGQIGAATNSSPKTERCSLCSKTPLPPRSRFGCIPKNR